MRIKLSATKQRELIARFKQSHCLTWLGVSQRLGISQSTLRDFYREKNLLPSEVYNILDPKGIYAKSIVETKEEHWGQQKGGLNSSGSLKPITLPENCKALAEIIGIILGDGNVHSYKVGNKIGVYSVRIAGDYEKDKEYHLEHIVPLCKHLFNILPRIRHHLRNNERFVCLDSKELVGFLGDIGVPSGDKIRNNVGIPHWIFSDKDFLKACVCGLIDTDGSVHRMSRQDPNLIRITFTNHCQRLLEDTRAAFIKLGFSPSKIIGKKKFFISRQGDITKYIVEIGFSNPKHRRRFTLFTAP